METAKCITKIRKSKGYSQAKIAEFLQTTQQQYSKYETGAQEIPVRHIKALCEFYNITANKLIGVDSYMTEEETYNKFEKLYKAVEDLICWAEYQEHIKEDAKYILIDNLIEIKNKIEEE